MVPPTQPPVKWLCSRSHNSMMFPETVEKNVVCKGADLPKVPKGQDSNNFNRCSESFCQKEKQLDPVGWKFRSYIQIILSV